MKCKQSSSKLSNKMSTFFSTFSFNQSKKKRKREQKVCLKISVFFCLASLKVFPTFACVYCWCVSPHFFVFQFFFHSRQIGKSFQTKNSRGHVMKKHWAQTIILFDPKLCSGNAGNSGNDQFIVDFWLSRGPII